MAEGSVLEDGSVLSRLDQVLCKVEAALALVCGLAIFSLMLFAVVSVGGRNILNEPLAGYVDWIEQVMPFIAFLGISYLQRLGGHIRMDILIAALSGRVFWALELLSTILILLLVLILIWGSWAHFERAFDWAAPMWSRDSSLDIRLPLWPAKLVVPIAFGVLALRLCLQIWGYGRAIIMNDERPVAVPLMLDAASVAAQEAATVSGREEDKNMSPGGRS